MRDPLSPYNAIRLGRDLVQSIREALPVSFAAFFSDWQEDDRVRLARVKFHHLHIARYDFLNDEVDLRKQIRKTILHEYGHHVGLTEHDLRKLGYG